MKDLLLLSVTDSFSGRTSLLTGIPNNKALPRDESTPMLDLFQIVNALAKLGWTANQELLLVKLIENALPYAKGFEVELSLEKLKQEIIALEKRKQERNDKSEMVFAQLQ